MSMKAVIFNVPGQPLVIENMPDPEPGEGEVVIKIARCGVCGTDLHMTSGHGQSLPAGSQLGHEYAGVVVAVGRGADALKVGDRIAGMPVVGCGQCAGCKTGLDIFCSTWVSYATALSEYAKVSVRGAVKLPQTVSLADGALIEPLAVGRRGVRLTVPTPDSKVVVIGPGPIGLAVVFWLRRAGVRNIVVLASTSRRRALAEAMGADHFILEGETVPEQIQAALGGMPDLVFDAAGVPGVINRAIELVRPQGTVLSLGFCSLPDTIIPAMAMFKDINIRFSVIYTRDDYKACADALDEDADRARSMVTETVSLAEFPAAFEALREGRNSSGKLLVDPWGM
jgi:threonine dehydrogenase-like Zn-dependent dehydrogenase